MAIDKNNKVEKAIKVASFIKDSMGKFKKKNFWRIINYPIRKMIRVKPFSNKK